MFQRLVKNFHAPILMACILILLTACAAPQPSTYLKDHPSPTAILVLGDSLSAHYRMNEQDGWVFLMEERLRSEQLIRGNQEVVNASVSGATSIEGLQKLPDLLDAHQPALIIIELGANDALRRQSMDKLKENLNSAIVLSQQSGARVLLVGVNLPSKMWFVPTAEFEAVYQDLADQHDVVLLENLLKDVNDHKELMMDDQLHPNEKGQPVILENVWPALSEALSG